MTMEKLMTAKEAAMYIREKSGTSGMNTAVLANMRFLKKGPIYKKMGRNIYYAKEDLDDFIESTTRIVSPENKSRVKPHLIRREAVLTMTSFSASMLRKMVERGEFPKPIKIGSCTFWSIDQVEKWIGDLVRKTYT